ncbi:LysR family transcriptional regulator [Nonomuraea sp. NPDC049695]|uniref:LysR family transcriptional regulator n=1 Tax=Nonomuraea sp. NPDC049695 TaxID=3154734 RepID=UPI0034145B9F
MLDTWALQVLVAVADHGSFSGAAEALSMTQPAVSRQIAGLERRVGMRLFTRVPRGVRPTPAGEVAVDLARDSLARLRTLEARLASFAQLASGELRLSAFTSANIVLVPEALRRFASAYPGVSLSLLQTDQAALLTAVGDGRIDLALVTDWHLSTDRDTTDASVPQRAVDGVELIPLLAEELWVALPAGHRLARQRRVRLSDLVEETWIEGSHPDCLGPTAPLSEALGAAPRIGFWCDDWNSKQALVTAGAGVMLVPTLAHSAIRPDVVLRATIPPLPTRGLYVAVAVPPLRAPAVDAMLGILTDLLAQPSFLTRRTRR